MRHCKLPQGQAQWSCRKQLPHAILEEGRTSSWPVTNTMRPPEWDGCASMELIWCLHV